MIRRLEERMGLDRAVNNWWQVQRGKQLSRALSDVDGDFWQYGSLPHLVKAKDAYQSWVREFPEDLRNHPLVGRIYFDGTIRLARAFQEISEAVGDSLESESSWRLAAHWYLVTHNSSPDPEQKAEAAYQLASHHLSLAQTSAAEFWINRLLETGAHFGSSTMTENLQLILEARKHLDDMGSKLEDLGMGPT